MYPRGRTRLEPIALVSFIFMYFMKWTASKAWRGGGGVGGVEVGDTEVIWLKYQVYRLISRQIGYIWISALLYIDIVGLLWAVGMPTDSLLPFLYPPPPPHLPHLISPSSKFSYDYNLLKSNVTCFGVEFFFFFQFVVLLISFFFYSIRCIIQVFF